MKTKDKLPLQQGIVYGVVLSRRLGRSLGINISPSEIKVCSMDCVYCQYSYTGIKTASADFLKNLFPSPSQVKKELELFLKKDKRTFDFITLSGNGEPTLNPHFPDIVEVIRELRNKYFRESKMAILSNATQLKDKKILESLMNIDLKIMKLDCGSEECFKKLNRPVEAIKLDDVVSALTQLKGNVIIQSLFVEGEYNNTGKDEIEKLIEKLKKIKPKHIQIYSLDRPPALKSLQKVSKIKLMEIKKKLEEEAKFKVFVY